MLEYENEMFLSALQEDGLTIVAKGLGLESMFINLLKVRVYILIRYCILNSIGLKKIKPSSSKLRTSFAFITAGVMIL